MRTRLQTAAARGLTRFVGRSAELAQMFLALERSHAGHGQVVALVGEPGVGKSRLVWEFTHSHRTQGGLILESASVSYGQASAYRPVIDLLKSYFQIEDRDDERRIREKATGKLLTLDETLKSHLVPLLALLDVAVDGERWRPLDPVQKRMRTLDACKRLVLREAQVQPLVLVVEDLHWIDSETQALLDSLVESLPTARLMLLVDYRPEYSHTWGNKGSYTQLRIDPLGQETAAEMLDALLGAEPTVQPLKPLLIGRTEGNPFFVEEGVRALVETGALVGERGAHRLVRPVAEVRVPATVQAVLAARIDRLPTADKRLLQTAAVIGKDVPLALLQAIADAPEAELQASLSRLQAGELLYAAGLFPELEYTFKHALTHEVAYGSLLQDRRRALDARIVEASEALYRGRMEEQIERLAHHALRGQIWEQAVAYCRQAGQRAGARSANREAVTYFEQALGALTHRPDRRDLQEASIDIRLELRNVLLPLNDFPSMFDHLREAARLAVALNDRRRLGWASAYLTAYYFNANMPSEAEAAGQLARAIADELGDVRLQVMAHFFLGLNYLYVCRYQESIAALTWNMEALSGDQVYERLGEPGLPAVFSRSYLVRALAEVGQFSEGVVRGDEAVQLSEATDLLFSLGSALEGLGYVYLRRGEIPRATALLERGLQICAERQFHIIYYPIAAYLGSAYALAGRDGEAQSLLERSVAIDAGLHPVLRVTLLGEAHLLAGRLVEAQRCVERALALAEVTEERGNRAWALRLLGEIAARRDPPDGAEAEARYRDALAIATELGMRPLVAHCHLGLGKLSRRTGKREQATEHLTTATTMYREMDMRFWLEQAEGEIEGLG